LASPKEIRVIQLIDSLEPGGAERMAVSYANALYKKTGFGALITTRAEGSLKDQLEGKVVYGFLNRKSTLDFKALWHLKKIVVSNKITHIQAHSSSIFFSVLLKIITPKIHIIWHDHYGKSEILDQRPTLALQIASLFINQIIAVNYKLEDWANKKLWCKKVEYLPNFTGINIVNTVVPTILQGENEKRIVCLANLRPQKNHLLLLKVAKIINKSHPDWTFHLIGKDFNDDYSIMIKEEIKTLSLAETVFVYGSKDDVSAILNQASIGVLTSSSEGLPVAILEYGFHKLPIVATSVGEIPMVISEDEGILVESDCISDFVVALETLVNNSTLQNKLATNLHKKIVQNYSEEAVLKLYLKSIY
jgi:glycosyltransferase involved in cell wall biosynthesis